MLPFCVDKSQRNRDAACGGLLALAAAVFYLSWPSRGYVFEGLFWAMPIDLGYVRQLPHGNYILYGFVGYLFNALARMIGFGGLAVWNLQLMDGLFGAAGLWLHFLTLRRLEVGRPAALLWSGILGVSLGYWRWSTEAEVYIFCAFLLELNLYALVRYAAGRGSAFHLGALQALAMAGHIVNAAFAPAAIWFLARARRGDWKKEAATYAATAAGLILAAYGAVLTVLVRPQDAVSAWHWFLGSANTPGGEIGWHGHMTVSGLGQWLVMTLHIFTSFRPTFDAPPAPVWSGAFVWAARLLLAYFGWVLAANFRNFSRLRRTAAVGCCVWLVGYACVFTSWEPGTMVYRVGDLIPLCLLLCLAGETGERFPRWATGALFVCLALGNFTAEVRPSSFESNNPALARMAFLKAHTNEGDWIAGQDGRDELYIPYFAQRRSLTADMFRDDPAALDRRIDGILAAGAGVYVTSPALGEPRWSSFFGRFAPREVARAADDYVLYRLTRSGVPIPGKKIL